MFRKQTTDVEPRQFRARTLATLGQAGSEMEIGPQNTRPGTQKRLRTCKSVIQIRLFQQTPWCIPAPVRGGCCLRVPRCRPRGGIQSTAACSMSCFPVSQAHVNREWANRSDEVLFPGIAREESHWTNFSSLPGVGQVQS